MIKKCICKKEVSLLLLGGEKRSKVGEIYDYQEEKMGDTRGNRQIFYDIYDGDNTFLFMLSEGEFENNFQDLEEWREQQLDEVLK